MSKFCINIDWFEVYTYEPVECYGAEWYETLGYKVAKRDYGTRVYAEMFTLIAGGHPWLEVRRSPLSKKSNGGILPDRSCSLRLVNRACYDWAPVADLYNFMRDLGFQYRDGQLCSITRADICVDFLDGTFTVDGSSVSCNDFIRDYLSGTWWKIGAAKIQAFGEEFKDGKHYHALKFGSPTSMVSTKLYNKTLEMSQVKIKPWIVETWVAAGLLQNEQDMATVWRLEFSVQGGADKWVTERNAGGELYGIPNTIDAWVNTSNYSSFIRGLCKHYFCFATKVDGQSKYRCPRFSPIAVPSSVAFRPVHLKPNKQTSGRGEKILVNKLVSLRDNSNIPDRFKDVLNATIYGLSYIYGTRAIEHNPAVDADCLRRLCDDYGDRVISAMFEEMMTATWLQPSDRQAAERCYYLYGRVFRDWVAGVWRKEPYSITAVQLTAYSQLTAEEKIAIRHFNKQLELSRQTQTGEIYETAEPSDAMDGWKPREKMPRSGTS